MCVCVHVDVSECIYSCLLRGFFVHISMRLLHLPPGEKGDTALMDEEIKGEKTTLSV